MTQDPRYPIGSYEAQPFSQTLKNKWLQDIEQLPERLEYAVINLDATQLQTPYRDGGWTIHQLVHHIADSHINAYTRFKLALTEDNPVIKTYEENLWVQLNDVKTLPVNISLTLLHALHLRWVAALKELKEADWNRMMFHPGMQKQVTLWYMLGNYAWHGLHHTAHINALRERMNW